MNELKTSQARLSTPPPQPQDLKPQTVRPKTEQPREGPAQVDMESAVKRLKDVAAQHDINLNFSVHKATGRTVIKVVDANTNKVVRELPPEQILDLMVSIEEMNGQLVSTTA